MSATPQVDETFVKQFEADIYDKLEKTYAGLPSTVRRDTIVGASSKDYPTGEQGMTVGTKGRNAEVPIQHPRYGKVTATVSDVYAARLLDEADQDKTNISLYDHHVRGFSGAFMRNRDSLIAEGMSTRAHTPASADVPAGKVVTSYDDDESDVLDLALFDALYQWAEDHYWPRGNRFMPLSPAIWVREFMKIQEVKDAQYVPESMLPFGDTEWVPTKAFMGTYLWALHDLPTTDIVAGTSFKRHVPFYHRDAVIYATQRPFKMTTAWENLKQAHSFVAAESHATVTIDPEGLIVVDKFELAANPLVVDAA